MSPCHAVVWEILREILRPRPPRADMATFMCSSCGVAAWWRLFHVDIVSFSDVAQGNGRLGAITVVWVINSIALTVWGSHLGVVIIGCKE